MRVAVASGKGGTGKTTIATGLALLLARSGVATSYVDCDVEEPNGRIFLDPKITKRTAVFVTTPTIDVQQCTNCGHCCDVCRFNALAHLPDRVLVFPELCHACGACALLCPEGAITEEPRQLGEIHHGTVASAGCGRGGEAGGGAAPAGDDPTGSAANTVAIGFLEGRLDVGEARGTPLIRTLKRELPDTGAVILDAPPGASCPVVETLRGADLVVLVTEPTPFGLSDLEQAIGVAGAVAGDGETVVVLNRVGMTDEGDAAAERLCDREGLPIVVSIPEDRAVAACSARGEMPVLGVDGYAGRLTPLVELVRERLTT